MYFLLSFCDEVYLVVGAYKQVNFLKLNKTSMSQITSKMSNEKKNMYSAAKHQRDTLTQYFDEFTTPGPHLLGPSSMA